MENEKVGGLISRLRREKGLTQATLAERLHVSDKAVSKWERGLGCPDISLINALAAELGVNAETLLSGELAENKEAADMNKVRFYVCPECGSVFTAAGGGEITCCGKKLAALTPRPADGEHLLTAESVEDEIYVTSAHPMTKEHYISFIAQVNFDRVTLVKTYPEQTLGVRFPQTGGRQLVWHCMNDGLFTMKL